MRDYFEVFRLLTDDTNDGRGARTTSLSATRHDSLCKRLGLALIRWDLWPDGLRLWLKGIERQIPPKGFLEISKHPNSKRQELFVFIIDEGSRDGSKSGIEFLVIRVNKLF